MCTLVRCNVDVCFALAFDVECFISFAALGRRIVRERDSARIHPKMRVNSLQQLRSHKNDVLCESTDAFEEDPMNWSKFVESAFVQLILSVSS